MGVAVGVGVGVEVGVTVGVAVGVAVTVAVGVGVAVTVAVAVGVGVGDPEGWSAPIAGGLGRASPSKSLVIPAIVSPEPTQGLAANMCKSPVDAFPFGLRYCGPAEMLLPSCPVAVRQLARVG